LQKVVFAIPTYGRAPCVEFQMSALETNNLCLANGITTVWRYAGGDPYVHKARSVLASEFLTLHKDATDLFFLDDDLGWEAAAVLRSLSRAEDVVAGIYPKKADYGEWPVEMQFDKDTMAPIERDGLFLASLAPTGFMRIKRHVMEAAAEESGIYDHHDLTKGTVKVWDFFRTGYVPYSENSREGRWWGEDFFFCVMVRNMGFEVWVDPNIYFSHRGSKAWEGRFRHVLEDKALEMKGGLPLTENTPAIKRWGEASDLGAVVGMAFDKAMAGHSDLPEEVLQMQGMVGRRYRMFVNNLMREIESPQYLEIGSYKGASAVAAAYGVARYVTCIDDFSMFGGPREEFAANLKQYGIVPTLLDSDFRAVDYSKMPLYNVFFYDGPHAEKDNYQAMRLVAAALDDEYVLIVDDWNWEQVRNGVFSGLRDSGQRILSAIEVRTVNRVNPLDAQHGDWHNGYLIAVVRKAAVALAEAAE
jgi:hypothetical protein